jgi:hypothetical protein
MLEIDPAAYERPERRLMRRVGGGFLVAGVITLVLGLTLDLWWGVDGDLGTVRVGVGSVELCFDGDCERHSLDEMARAVRVIDGEVAGDVQAWADAATHALIAMAVTAVVAGLAALWSLLYLRRRGTRALAIAAIALAPITALLVLRFATSCPIPELDRGLLPWFVVLGQVDLIGGGVIVLLGLRGPPPGERSTD